MIPYFQALGERIQQQWILRSYNEEVFPEVALEQLSATPPHQYVSVRDIIDWVYHPAPSFQQPNTSELFGEPPVMLYQAPRFYIEALFWFSGTTAIHEHSFSGAFAVLAGSSIHSHWRFSPSRAVNSRLLFGQLERVSTEILRQGGVRPIHSGDRLIHQLFHLETPSITVVVRTYVDRDHLPQYRYILPGLAIDDKSRDATQLRRLLLLDAMARGQIEGLSEHSHRLIEEGDIESLYYCFSLLTRRKTDANLMEDFYEGARRRHGEIADRLREVCAWEQRNRVIVGLRSKVTNPEPRFLLALLMLMPNRDAIYETILLQFPDAEPLSMIEVWLGDMNKETIGFAFDDTNKILFRGLVEGLNMADLFERLGENFQSDSISEYHDRLLEHIKKMARSNLFFSLFSESPLRKSLLLT